MAANSQTHSPGVMRPVHLDYGSARRSRRPWLRLRHLLPSRVYLVRPPHLHAPHPCRRIDMLRGRLHPQDSIRLFRKDFDLVSHLTFGVDVLLRVTMQQHPSRDSFPQTAMETPRTGTNRSPALGVYHAGCATHESIHLDPTGVDSHPRLTHL